MYIVQYTEEIQEREARKKERERERREKITINEEFLCGLQAQPAGNENQREGGGREAETNVVFIEKSRGKK